MDTRTRTFSPANLRRLRKQAGLSRRQLADMVGVSQLTISVYEQGRCTPSVKAVAALAAAFGCTLDDLFTMPADDLFTDDAA